MGGIAALLDADILFSHRLRDVLPGLADQDPCKRGPSGFAARSSPNLARI